MSTDLKSRGIPEQEAMCRLLDCTPAGSADSFDFAKGTAKFEFKYSRLYPQHPREVREHKRKEEFCWVWANLMGYSGEKSFDFIILEGQWHHGTSRYFLIPYDDFARFLKRKHTLFCTATIKAPKPGRTQKFIFAHECRIDDLQRFVFNLPEDRTSTRTPERVEQRKFEFD